MDALGMEPSQVSDEERDTPQDAGPVLAWDVSTGRVPIGFGGDAEPLILDWTGAGKHDLLVTACAGLAGREARLFRPLTTTAGLPPVYDGGELLPALNGLRGVCSIRNSRPTRFDLVALAPEGLVWLENEGEPTSPRFNRRTSLELGPELGIGPCRVVQVASVDWDGDGLDDLLVGIDDLVDYWPDGDRVPTSQQRGFNQRGGHPGYDQNGLWRGRAPVGRVFWLRNVGSFQRPRFERAEELAGETHPLDVGLHPAPLGVAWERPNAMQLLLTDRRGLIRVHRNFGDQRPPVLMEPRTLLCGGAPFQLPDDRVSVVAADLDGDRRDELVYGTSDGRIFAVHAGAGRHEVKTPHVVTHESSTLWLGGESVLTAGDLDDDGGLDLIAGVSTGRLWHAHDLGRAGRHRYKAPVAIEAGGAPFQADPCPDGMLNGPTQARLGYACPLLADWSGHGRLDLLVGTAGGEVLLLRNDGARNDPRFGAPQAFRCQGAPLITPPRVRPAVAAWRGGEELDLLSLDLQGFLCVYPRIGKAEVGPPSPIVDRLGRLLRLDGGFGLSGRCALWAGDWSGSGHPDILVGLPLANRHVVPAITGLAFPSLEAIPNVLLLENLGHGVVCPRLVYHADGQPLIVGDEGASPMGVPSASGKGLDLLVGASNGSVTLIARDQLRW